jgi:hypothetical protein
MMPSPLNVGSEYIVTRDVTGDECPWIEKYGTVKKGTIVVAKSDPYSCCSLQGNLCKIPGFDHGIELPLTALVLLETFINNSSLN